MKFRALITESPEMKEFMSIVMSISKFSKHCVMRLTTKKVYFIISEEDTGPRRPLVWCELPVSFYFKEFSLAGVNEQHNEIYLEVPTVLLARSLALLKHDVKLFKIKLTNKDTPCITVEMELAASETANRQVVHDIPVDVISRKHWSDYAEPTYDDFHVTIQIPNSKVIRNICERMRNVSHSLTVSANKNGRLTLQTETNIVKLAAHFPEITLESFTGPFSSQEIDEEVSCTVDMKKFLVFLSGLQITNCKTLCSIVHSKMVKFFMEQPGALSIQIFLTEISN